MAVRHHLRVADAEFLRLVAASLPLLRDLATSGVGVTYDFSRVFPPDEPLPDHIRERAAGDQELARQLWLCAANIDNRWGPTSPVEVGESIPTLTVMLASAIQPAMAHEVELWPVCPHHGDHALECQVQAGEATWSCESDAAVIFVVGTLPSPKASSAADDA